MGPSHQFFKWAPLLADDGLAPQAACLFVCTLTSAVCDHEAKRFKEGKFPARALKHLPEKAQTSPRLYKHTHTLFSKPTFIFNIYLIGWSQEAVIQPAVILTVTVPQQEPVGRPGRPA